MKELNLTEILKDNDLLHKKINKLKEIGNMYKEALTKYSRQFHEKSDFNAAEEALDRGKKLEKLL